MFFDHSMDNAKFFNKPYKVLRDWDSGPLKLHLTSLVHYSFLSALSPPRLYLFQDRT